MNTIRIVKLDIARTFAIFCVVLCHCSEMIYTQQWLNIDGTTITSRLFMVATFTIGRMGVPIFLFLSGALLLKKSIDDDDDILRFYKHNLLPLIIVNEIWVLLYKLYSVYVLNGSFRVIDLIKELLLIKNCPMTNMWYMPVIIGIYIGVPFLAKIVKTFSFKSVQVIMIAIFIFSFIVPGLNVFSKVFNINEIFGSDIYVAYMAYVLYILLGYYINNKKIKINKVLLIFVFLSCYTVTVYVEMCSFKSVLVDRYKVWYDFPFLLIGSACLFDIFIQIKDEGINKNIAKVFTYISKMSMGIFFMHVLILMTLIKYMGQITGRLSLDVIILLFITFFLSIFIVTILSRFKYLKKYMFLIK